MTSRLSRWIDWLLATPTPAPEPRPNIHTTDTPETSMPTSTPTAVDEQLLELRRQLDEIATESAADPLSLAADVQSWRRRETARQDRAVELEQKHRQLLELGSLTFESALMDAVRRYTADVAEPRGKLAPLVATRTFPGQRKVSGAPKALTGWWESLAELIAVLPDDDEYARQLILREFNDFIRHRDSWFQALAVHLDGANWVPAPEVDQLPSGYRYGLHRVDQ